jgi:hypothetical protein
MRGYVAPETLVAAGLKSPGSCALQKLATNINAMMTNFIYFSSAPECTLSLVQTRSRGNFGWECLIRAHGITKKF